MISGETTEDVVVRFAPSPTGMFHVGSARTALFNWMWARRTGGRFLLRIEDTDSSRSTPESREQILASMRRLGLTWDGEVYTSSEHRVEHLAAAARLVETGRAYHCRCTREEIDARGIAVGSGYDGHCRNLDVPAESSVVRLKNPGGTITFEDTVLGTNTTSAGTFGDFPLVKSNGDPLFLLGNVYDDAAMGVNWVVRGADHLPNNPKYILVWNALLASGVITMPLPRFAHLPLIVGASGKKLSKRRDKVDVLYYLDELGILPSALLTYLAGLGWGAPEGAEKELIEVLTAHFELSRVGASNAVLDLEKLKAVNSDHLVGLHEKDPEGFVETIISHLDVIWALGTHPELVAELPSRMRLLEDARALLTPIFEDVPLDAKSAEKWLSKNPNAKVLLHAFLEKVKGSPWDAETLHTIGEELSSEHGLGMMKATMPIRVAALRHAAGMPLFTALAALGRNRTAARIEEVLEKL